MVYWRDDYENIRRRYRRRRIRQRIVEWTMAIAIVVGAGLVIRWVWGG